MPLRPSPPPAPHRHRARGFTLIEVLVALFVLALMAGMAWQGVDMVVRSRDSAQARMEKLLRVQSALAQWEIDLHETFDTGVVPGLNFDGATLRLTRRQPEGAQVVVWSLRGHQLKRWASPPTTLSTTLQEAWMATLQFQGRESGQLDALDGISQWQLYHYSQQSQSWSNAQSTGDVQQGQQDNAGARQKLPDGVRLVLQFEPETGFGGPITRDLLLVHP